MQRVLSCPAHTSPGRASRRAVGSGAGVPWRRGGEGEPRLRRQVPEDSRDSVPASSAAAKHGSRDEGCEAEDIRGETGPPPSPGAGAVRELRPAGAVPGNPHSQVSRLGLLRRRTDGQMESGGVGAGTVERRPRGQGPKQKGGSERRCGKEETGVGWRACC